MVYRLKSQRPGTAITRPTEAHLLQRLHLHVLCIAGRAEDPLVKVLFFCKLAEAGPAESAASSCSACFAQIKRSNSPLRKVGY